MKQKQLPLLKNANTDHLSGSNIDTDETGKVVEMADYYPFGALRLDHTTTAYRNPYKFTGKELDGDSGLYYYSARYYNAEIGRFISQDPWEGDLKDPQSLNRYSYVRNNPLRYIDPTGQFVVDKSLLDNKLNSDLTCNADCVLGSNSTSSNTVDYSNFESEIIDESGNPKQYDFSRLTDTDDMMETGITGGIVSKIPIVGKLLKLTKKNFFETSENTQASISNISASEAKRIQNAADRIQQDINVVGSRARGTAKADSDWDYVVEGLTKNLKDKIKNSLPKGEGGGKLNGTKWSGMDLDKGPLIKSKPYIKFTPKK